MGEDGTCPTCGRVLEAPSPTSTASAATAQRHVSGKELRELAGEQRTPWHFKLLVVAAIGYLIWRLLDLVGVVG
jgi:hypothetical protein